VKINGQKKKKNWFLRLRSAYLAPLFILQLAGPAFWRPNLFFSFVEIY
jgi:hypothetical protein